MLKKCYPLNDIRRRFFHESSAFNDKEFKELQALGGNKESPANGNDLLLDGPEDEDEILSGNMNTRNAAAPKDGIL